MPSYPGTEAAVLLAMALIILEEGLYNRNYLENWTNWKEYLPPSFQKVVFFPSLYAKEELNNWGKEWVDHIFNPEKVSKPK